jgi:hypothetical protein
VWGVTELLQQLLCLVKNLIYVIVAAGCSIVNVIVAATGAFLSLIVSLFPAMPAVPTNALDGQFISTLNWIFPVGAFLTAAMGILFAYAVVLAIQIAARWVKAL